MSKAASILTNIGLVEKDEACAKASEDDMRRAGVSCRGVREAGRVTVHRVSRESPLRGWPDAQDLLPGELFREAPHAANPRRARP